MNIGFAGSDSFSLEILSGLKEMAASRFSLDLILTIPAKSQGRGRVFSDNPVTSFSKENNLQIETISSSQVLENFLAEKISNLDYLIVASFGCLLTEETLALPKYGCINVQPSLLPKWRGAAPIQRAIEAGDEVTGVSVMKMISKLDAGPVWKVGEYKIGNNDNYMYLEKKLAKISLDLLRVFVETPYDRITFKPQSQTGITYAKKIEASEMEIDWALPATEVARKVNAFYSKMCAHTFLDKQRIKLGHVEVLEPYLISNKPPGTLVIGKKKKESTLTVYCGKGMLKINLLQKAGGKWLDANSFINGLKGYSEILLGGNS